MTLFFRQLCPERAKSRRLRSPLHTLPEAFRNHRFSRRKPLGPSCLARQAPQLVTAALLDSPNTSLAPSETRAESREDERGGSSLDGLGYVRLKRIELQIELSRDGGQSDIAIKTRLGLPATARVARGSRIGGKVARHGAVSKHNWKRQLAQALVVGIVRLTMSQSAVPKVATSVIRFRRLVQLNGGECPASKGIGELYGGLS
jgi:hypothetical protein